MFLKTNLEKKLDRSAKEFSLIEDSNNNASKHSFNVIRHPKHKKLDPKKIYTNDIRVFNSEDMTINARLAKEYIKSLKDPDILELHQKRWNASTRPNPNFKPELKKTLFEVRHGLKDVNLVIPKPKKIELGTDSRNVCYFGWDGSTRFHNFERKSLEKSK